MKFASSDVTLNLIIYHYSSCNDLRLFKYWKIRIVNGKQD